MTVYKSHAHIYPTIDVRRFIEKNIIYKYFGICKVCNNRILFYDILRYSLVTDGVAENHFVLHNVKVIE